MERVKLIKRFFNKKELSEYIGITQGTLSVWVCHRKIPYVKVGRLVKFDMKKIETWLEDKSVEICE